MARLLSLNVGLPRDVSWQGRTVRTAIWKAPVEGRRMVRRLNIDGDGQGDLAGHGGEHRAVFVYQIESYHYWQTQLGRTDFTFGEFGENFTVEGMADDKVCIGDHYRVGSSALFEVTQPRVTCYRIGIRMNEPQMAALLVSHGRPGFYLRVVEEGEVAAGDEIVRVMQGPEGMTVSEVNALLYKPGHPAERLERALRIPALSAGWQGSFKTLLEKARAAGATTGVPRLAVASGPRPAWTGFRPLRVSGKTRESGSVTSLLLEPVDGNALAPGVPGQYVALRLRPGPEVRPLLRSYSLSAASTEHYRVSVKRNIGGVAGAYIADDVQPGDIVEVTAPRGGFALRPGDGPVVLLSAGIGATPVLAILNALAAATSPREVWWLHGARNRAEHPFADEVRAALKMLPHAHSHIRYSAAAEGDRAGIDFDAPGRLGATALAELGVPRAADFYLCGPAAFMADLPAELASWGVSADRIHTEIFGAGPSLTPGIAATPQKPPHAPTGPAGTGPLVSFARSGLNVRWGSQFQSLLELAEACDVPVRWSCRTGVCHNCETALVAGAIVYQPDPIEPPADGNVLICCSLPRGEIALDL